MKSVLISIQPKWCELIASGKKTVEVRKTRPKIKTPFKCYIYETNWKDNTYWKERHKGMLGKVIGEFVCDLIKPYWFAISDDEEIESCEDVQLACLSVREIQDYGGERGLYFWHISDLVIYDKPRALSKFQRACPDHVYECAMCRHSDYTGMRCTPITRPFQSWGYVEGERE